MKKMTDRIIRWNKSDREWLGYKRREAYMDKKDVSLSEPPWKDREANAGDNPSPLPEVSVSLSKENKWTKD